MAMGAADLVPGVSGGTIAFISGIYEELVHSLQRLTPSALKILFQQGWRPFWQHINGTFLATLVAGVLISIFSLARIVAYALEHHRVLVWGFFFGLMVASIMYIGRQLPLRSLRVWVALALGTLVALLISVGQPVQLPGDWWMMAIAGSIAICAMILPGVSGSFLLLLMGVYPVFLRAVAELNWALLGSFLVGAVSGLLLFSHFLSWLLRHYRDLTLATLTGFLIGSLNIVWPWKQTVKVFMDRHGNPVPLVQENLLPAHYAQATGSDPQTTWVILLAVTGLVLVLGLEYLGARRGVSGSVRKQIISGQPRRSD
jgi:putative membrane protein